MKQFSLSTVLLTCLALFLFASRATAQAPNQAPLTNASVVKLVKAGFKDKTIMTIIGSRAGRFDLSTDGLVELKRNRVSERIILAMLHQQEGIAFDEDDFADESPFGSNNDLKRSGLVRIPAKEQETVQISSETAAAREIRQKLVVAAPAVPVIR